MRVFGKCKFCNMPIYMDDKRCCYCGNKTYESKYVTEIEEDELDDYAYLANYLPDSARTILNRNKAAFTLFSHDDYEDEFHYVDSGNGIIYVIFENELINTIYLGRPVVETTLYNNDCVLFKDEAGDYFFYEDEKVMNLTQWFALNKIKSAFIQKNSAKLTGAVNVEFLLYNPETKYKSADYYVYFGTANGSCKIKFNVIRHDDGNIEYKAELQN